MKGKEPTDPLEEFGEKVRAGINAGRFIFESVLKPKAKEVFETAKGAVEAKINQVRDSFDPTRGLAKNAVEARDWLITKGLSLKRANEVVVETVRKAVNETKPKGEEKNE